MRRLNFRWATALALTVGPWGGASAMVPPPDPPAPLGSLKTVPVPEPPNLGEFVQNKSIAIVLGKALFWDMQVGGDGVQACASCHFHSGADNRRKNQLNPGLLAGDTTFQVGGPNYTVRPKDFPITANDVMSSQGVFKTRFADVAPPSAADVCSDEPDIFHVGPFNTRRVEPRNAPSMVNSVFNFRNFWDGRANNNFNGQSVFGQRDPNARVFKADATGNIEAVSITLPVSSLASQAVGPPTSEFEMSCAGRFWAKVGEKLLHPGVIPLAKQRVHPQDSVLGPWARPGSGLNTTYADLVRQAFRPEWWSSSQTVTVAGQAFTQMQANFALLFGLAVQLYEATLVADDTRFDRFLEGNSTALTDFEKQGLDIFQDRGRCRNCHGGPELTNASVRNVMNQRIERMIMGDGGCAIYDNGFYNIGVRPTAEDLGVGGTDPFGNPLSETRMVMQGKLPEVTLDPPLGAVPECDGRANVDGAFKTPGLRGVELSGPFFHNGGKATLRQVVEFYNRGGDFADQNIANLDPDISPIGLTSTEIGSVVAFLQALTDERVRQDQAPFDHPQLFRPQGHPGDDKSVAPGSGMKAADELFEVPAVGAGGRPALGLNPLQPFLTVVKMTGSGTLDRGRQAAVFDLRFDVNDDDAGTADIRFRVRDHARRLKVKSDQVDTYFTTETCLEASGPATVNDSPGYRYELKACDNGQPGHEEDFRGRTADTFDVLVTGPTGTVYQRSGPISSGNIHAHVGAPSSGGPSSASGEAFGASINLAAVQLGKTAAVTLAPGSRFVEASVPNLQVMAVTTAALDSSTSGVVGENASTAQSTSTVANVNVLSGLIRAEHVVAVASSSSNGRSATSSGAGSQILGLVINGVAMGDVTPAPNTTMNLPGVGVVILNEQQPTGDGVTSTGLQVNMIHVVLRNLLGIKTGEIILGSARSGATFVR